MERLIDQLRRRQWKLGSCESITGGDFASRLTDVSGASDVYLGGYIVYSDVAKSLLTFVDDDILKEFGAVSCETVEQMAKSTKKALNCDIAIAFSGNAGPKASSNQPVGRVFTAIAVMDHCLIYQDDFVGSRKEIKTMTIEVGIQRILDLI